MNRGSFPWKSTKTGTGPCFNEAPIHESGKSLHGILSLRRYVRFNEAPIHESGKCLTFSYPASHGTRASMRPRFMNRGSKAIAMYRWTPWKASMRPRFMNRGSSASCSIWQRTARCFNEAPIHESGKSRRGPRPGQLASRFNEAPIHESGKFPEQRKPREINAASMRPRFMNRGSGGRNPPREEHMNGFNEAPIHESGKSPSRRPTRSPRRSFNEAPIHESGKSPSRRPTRSPRRSFNEAPIHESGKCLPETAATLEPGPASMRPRFMNRGSQLRQARDRQAVLRFNEAPIHESGK